MFKKTMCKMAGSVNYLTDDKKKQKNETDADNFMYDVYAVRS